MCERTSDSVYSQAVEATCTDEPRNNNHVSPRCGESDPEGAMTTAAAKAPAVKEHRGP